MGFCMCLTPLSCDLMGWRGAGGDGAAGMYVSLLCYPENIIGMLIVL